MSSIHVKIVTPAGIYRELDTTILNVQTTDGDRGILPSHMPLVAMLNIGKMATVEEDGRQEYAVAGGLLYFRDNVAEIITDAIEHKADIDVNRASAAKERAQERLDSKDPDIDVRRAEAALKKAINRMKVAGV